MSKSLPKTSSTDTGLLPPSLIWFGEQWLLGARLLQDAFTLWADVWSGPAATAPDPPEEPFLEPARLVGVD